MLIPSEDRTLAFFESLILNPKGIENLKESFITGIKESFASVNLKTSDDDVVIAYDRDEFDNIIEIPNDFKVFLKKRLKTEKQIAKEFIDSKSAKILSSNSLNSSFFAFTEATLIDLKNAANKLDYNNIYDTVLELISFFYSKYNKYHNFSRDYLETLSIYRKETKSNKISLSFNWREQNKKKEIKFLYNKLIEAKPPFINSSLETFIKAFTDKPLEVDEKIKWLCLSVKNKNKVSQVTLVELLKALFKNDYIISDFNDFNKTVVNIFCKPNGERLKNIKVSKQEKSKNPSRIQEIQAILKELATID
ncbi:MAG TPA: hypothetical protein PLV43_10345 [Aequorivita sp.]|nr:hypothetical protein [Aequorivita sp.]